MSDSNEINLGAGSQAQQAAAGSNISQTYIAQQIVNAPAPPSANAQEREFVAPFQALADLQTFVGRAEHLKTLAGLGAVGVTNPPLHMRSGQGFLIAGIGGLGKTSLAIHVAHQLRHVFDGGVLWADVPTTEPFTKLDDWARLYGGDLREFQEMALPTLTGTGLKSDQDV